PASSQPAGQPPASSQPAPPPSPTVGAPVKPQAIAVYNPEGKGDNAARAKYAIDGKAETQWRTEQYKQQFPAIKPGVGLVVTFKDPINLSQVLVSGGTAGTKVEIRSATEKNPDLADTKVVGNGDLKDGDTTIPLAQPTQGEYFIVWITQLGGADEEFQTEIADLTFLPAG
ncbi:hypothetical protein GTY80_11800, partial [Amycolatopsis sp. SID8362]|nr:hypothetical protein [Amycolatopsis sp. SID8362]NED40623.1 hypothetical protein [Amycolatopsis sp. SID8362]